MHWLYGIALLLSLDASAPPADGGAARATSVEITGHVRDVAGRDVTGVRVFAVATGEARMLASAHSGAGGRFRLVVAHPHPDVGIISARWVLSSVRATGKVVEIVVHDALAGRTAEETARTAKGWAFALLQPRGDRSRRGSAMTTAGPTVGMLAGRVVDETGIPLTSTAVMAIDRAGRPTAVALTDRAGRYSLVGPAGPANVCAIWPGLKVVRARRTEGGDLDFVMTIDAAAERIVVREGRVIQFRMDESIWPEYLPPPAVRVLLEADYQIDLTNSCFCPGDLLTDPPQKWKHPCRGTFATCLNPTMCPASVWQRQCKVPRYWWLKIIQLEPPNPARSALRSDWTRWWEDAMREQQEVETRREGR